MGFKELHIKHIFVHHLDKEIDYTYQTNDDGIDLN